MGLKSGDNFTIPMCLEHHKIQHGMNERFFYEQYGGITKASKLANELFEHTGSTEKAIELISKWRQE